MIAIPFMIEPPDGKMHRAGYEAEKQLAFYRDRAFRESAYDFRVFHGLRIDRKGDVAQIDHLVLHRFRFVIIESKSVVDSISINQHGEFTRWFARRPQGMPSPIAQARRQRDLLRQVLRDNRERLRRAIGIGPFKMQGDFGEQRFDIVVAISDRGQINCTGQRPAEIMKAESVVPQIQQRFDYLRSLSGVAGLARSLVSEVTDRQKARQMEQDHVPPYADDEIDRITEFLVSIHQPLVRPPATAAAQPQVELRPPVPVTKARVESTPAVEPVTSRNLARWSSEEEKQLAQAFRAGKKPAELAPIFGRTTKALRMRAVKLGLIADADAWQ
jgi:hypothetical protein